jgi:hypothetical protein
VFEHSKKSILFHNPDYHCSFFYRDELRKIGWKADIFVPDGYPKKLLYSDYQILTTNKYTKKPWLNYIIWFIRTVPQYRYILYYGRPPDFNWVFRKVRINSKTEPLLLLLKILRKKVIYIPSGCRDEFTQAAFSFFDHGNICANCGFYDQCDEESNIRNLFLINKYADLVIGAGFTKPNIKKLKNIKYKAFNLKVFDPNLEVPQEFTLPKSNQFRILHTTSLENRTWHGKNIKGSWHIEKAIEKLKKEGYSCELIRINNLRSADMRFYQVQVDLIIDQLIYGHWGSTSLEGVALGKPVICYFNDEWKKNYIDTFDIEVWPFIEANPETIYTVIKQLMDNRDLLPAYSRQSIEFSKLYLDVSKNAKEFTKILKSI